MLYNYLIFLKVNMSNITLENSQINSTDKANTNFTGKEEWRKVPGFSRYHVSNLGRIKLISGRIATRKPHSSGYIRIGVVNNEGLRETQYLHVLIALSFIPNPDNKERINHLNGLRDDNKVTNLEWCTQKENCNRKIFTNHPGSPKKIGQYDMTGKILLKIWDSILEVSRKENYSENSIINMCKLNGGLYKNYRWKYYSEELEGEEWKELKINDITIKLSSLGRVSTRTKRVSFGSTTRTGYKRTTVGKKSFLLHRLLCMVFKPIENYNRYEDYKHLVTNHCDNIGTNNNINNLEWCTHKENTIHSVKFRTYTNHSIRRVKQFNEDGEVIATFGSIKEANIATGCNRTHIGSVCRGKRKLCGGYKWEYADM